LQSYSPGKRKARKAILLYGPPGTGKSYLAKAIATKVECTLFSISSSDVLANGLGKVKGWSFLLHLFIKSLTESLTLPSRPAKLRFQTARKRKPAVIFIDEIEALCGKCGGIHSEYTDRVKTEVLVQMDGVGNDISGIVVLDTTNMP
jgi:vacuolar protein-sorting-associated protein 4